MQAASSLTGSFAVITQPSVPGLTFDVLYDYTVAEKVTLRAVINEVMVPVTVTNGITHGWVFAGESTGAPFAGAGVYVHGPATPPLGFGSAHLTTTNVTTDQLLAINDFAGLPLRNLSALRYSINYATGHNGSVSLQFNIDDDVNDAATGYRGRLLFVPNAPPADTWTERNAMNPADGIWYATPAFPPAATLLADNVNPALKCGLSGPGCTITQVRTLAPDAAIHPNPVLAAILFKADGSAVNAFVDKFVFGVNAVITAYNYEPNCTTLCYANSAIGNDTWAGTTPAEPLKTIQGAINRVSAGGQVIAAAGLYTENITATKSVTITGAKGGMDAAPGFAAFVGGKANPISETIMVAPSNNPAGGNPGANDMIRVIANNVIIDGLVVDGNNPALGASTTVLEGVDAHARRGLTNIADNNSFNPVSGLVLRNSVLQNFGQRGVSLANNGPATKALLERNVFGATSDQNVILFTNAYADVIRNTFVVISGAIGMHWQKYQHGDRNGYSHCNKHADRNPDRACIHQRHRQPRVA